MIRNPSPVASNWRSVRTLDEELKGRGITAIAITGTRALTLHLRERGAMRAAISTTGTDPQALTERVLASPPMIGADLAREVTTPEPYLVAPPAGQAVRFRVAAVDLGIKAATPVAMAGLGCEVHVLPATTTAAEILADQPRRRVLLQRPRRPGRLRLRGRRDAGRARRRRSGVRHLPGQPGARPGARPAAPTS